MAMLFGDNSAPTPAPVPQSPSDATNAAAVAARNEAEQAALAETKAAGRRQTVVAGAKLAAEDQQNSGLLAAKNRAASRALVG